MNLEQILQTMSEYWEVFITSGAYVTLSAYGAVIIKQLFTKATASLVVEKITNSLNAMVLFIKNKVIKTSDDVSEIKTMLSQFIIKQEAFNKTILENHSQEDRILLENSYQANITNLSEFIQNVEQVVEKVANEVVEVVVAPETRKERKLRLKNEKKVKSEVRNEEIKELY